MNRRSSGRGFAAAPIRLPVIVLTALGLALSLPSPPAPAHNKGSSAAPAGGAPAPYPAAEHREASAAVDVMPGAAPATSTHSHPTGGRSGDGAKAEAAHAAHGSWAETDVERALAWLGKLHPALTHFPIALLIAAAVGELWGLVGGNRRALQPAVRYCAGLGAAAALVTAVLGWLYAGFDLAADDGVLAAHRWIGTALVPASLAVLWIGVGPRTQHSGRRAATSTGLLLLAAALVAINGHLGGRMLYGPDHYAYPAAGHDRDDDRRGH